MTMRLFIIGQLKE